MAQMNTSASIPPIHNHHGVSAYRHITPTQQLRRLVLSCLLWENEFYVDGKTIAEQISEMATKVPLRELADLAIEARSQFHLRHVPLLLLCILARLGQGTNLVSETIAGTIQRADELTEFVAIYAHMNGVEPKAVKKKLSAQVKKGLAKAFLKFDRYQLSKYNRDTVVKLRDVIFLCHARPKDDAQRQVWDDLINNRLAPPDTWESALVGGADKKETFERLLREENLGYLALLRNLRGMAEAGVDRELIIAAIQKRKGAERVLPFRFTAAARACPQFEPWLDQSLITTIAALPVFDGITAVLIDVSHSMNKKLSEKSDMTRMDAGATLACIIQGQRRLFSFSSTVVEVAPRLGMAGVDAIVKSQIHHSTYLGAAITKLANEVYFDRLIVLTDEESQDPVPNPPEGKKAYMINVASSKNGIGYGPWVHIDGFSERVIKFIHEYEKSQVA